MLAALCMFLLRRFRILLGVSLGRCILFQFLTNLTNRVWAWKNMPTFLGMIKSKKRPHFFGTGCNRRFGRTKWFVIHLTDLLTIFYHSFTLVPFQKNYYSFESNPKYFESWQASWSFWHNMFIVQYLVQRILTFIANFVKGGLQHYSALSAHSIKHHYRIERDTTLSFTY